MLLLKHFDELTVLHKNAIDLKGLILQLAVQGKLTSDWRSVNRNIEAASILLKRCINTKKNSGIPKRNNQNVNISINLSQLNYSLPKEWETIKMDDLFRFIDYRGKTPKKTNDGVKLITAKNVRFGYLDINPEEFMSKSEYLSWMTRGFPNKGDILFTTEAPLGNVCQINLDEEFGLAQRLITLQPYLDDINNRFFLYILMSKTVQNLILEQATGMTAKGIKSSRLKTIPLPLPSLEEQKAIVEIIDALFQEIDQLEQCTQQRIQLKEQFASSALHRLTTNNSQHEWAYLQKHFHTFFNEETNIKKLRETILQLAVQGKLTSQWRSRNPYVEPASVLLERIKEEKEQMIKEGKMKKEKTLQEIKEEEKPYDLPEGWVWCRLGNMGIINPRNNGENEFDSGFVPMTQISELFGVNPTFETRKWQDIKQGYTHFQNDDVAFAKITPCFQNSKACVFRELPNGIGAGTTELHVFRKITDDTLPEYVYLIFKSTDFLRLGKERMTGSAGQKRVPKDYFINYIIGLPPVKEQQAIVEKINRLMALCDELEQQVQKSKQRSGQLMQAVIREVLEPEGMGMEV